MRHDENTRAAFLFQKLRKCRRHSLEVLGHKNSVVTRCDFQHLKVRKPSQVHLIRRLKINSRLSPLDAQNYYLIQIGVSLKTNFHGFDVCLWRI